MFENALTGYTPNCLPEWNQGEELARLTGTVRNI